MGNNFTEKTSLLNNVILIEIGLILFLFISFLFIDYLIFWQPTLNHFWSENKLFEQKRLALTKKQLQLIHERKTLSTLRQWKHENTDFYAVISSVSNINQQLSLLTRLIQKAHFNVIQLSKTNKVNHSFSNCTVSLNTTGQFIDLFSLITTLNHFAIPFTLSELSIESHQFKMTFILRGIDA